jgi:hypothetical protein
VEILEKMIRAKIIIPLIVFTISCRNNTEPLNSKQSSDIQDSVRLLTESIAKNVSREGPVAWLRYFEDAPEFFMAADGQLVFPNIDTATNFINNVVVKSMPKIELRWSNIRIDPLAHKLASISAIYHEDITDPTGKITPHDGYFTAIAHQTSQGWKLHNAHWSSIATK